MENNKFGKYLFHYSKMSTTIEHILDTFELQFSKFANLNDPIENKKFSISVWQKFSYNINYDFFKKMKNADDIFYNKSNILCFSINKCDNNKIIAGCNFYRMWSHYGENFKGVCLYFDRRKIINEIYNQYKNDYVIFNKKIKYIDLINSEYLKNYSGEKVDIKSNKLNIIHNKILKHLIKNNNRLYFTKDYDWQGESEYRIVLFNKNFSNENNNIKVKILDSLVGIILGCNTSENYIKLFKVLLKDKNIKLYKQENEGLVLKLINLNF